MFLSIILYIDIIYTYQIEHDLQLLKHTYQIIIYNKRSLIKESYTMYNKFSQYSYQTVVFTSSDFNVADIYRQSEVFRQSEIGKAIRTLHSPLVPDLMHKSSSNWRIESNLNTAD